MRKNLFITPMNTSPSFKGHILGTNEKGEKVYQFYLPVENNSNVQAEVVVLNSKNELVQSLTPTRSSNAPIPVWTLPVSSIQDKDVTVAYRFMSNGNPILDNTLKWGYDNKLYNEATKLTRAPLTMPKQMLHLIPDNFNPNGGQIMYDEFGQEIQRNHFNLFGGTLQGIIDELDSIKAMGARRIISCPIFGDDTVSNHGYWTVDPYRTTSTMGNKNDFKKLIVGCFKRGSNWTADGAFANEGIEGIHIQDIIRWGEKSPYLDWFDITDFNQSGLKFGVLPPVGSEAEKHYDFKIVNSPLLYTFDKDGRPSADFGKINPNYDRTQPTYLQQFDRRLMDKDYINSPEMLGAYTKKQLEDVHAIRNYQDSVQLYHYNVAPAIVEEKIKAMKKVKLEGQSSTHSMFRDSLKKWQYFSLEHVDKEGAIRNWVGKKDVFALNYLNPKVQNYILGVPKYWTDGSDKTLTTYIVNRLSDVADEESKLTEIQNIAKLFNVKLTPEELKHIAGGTYQIQLAPAKSSIAEQLKDFPLVASEAPREIASLFSDPKVIESPKLNKVYEKNIAPMVEEIFRAAHPKAFNNSGQLTDEGKHLFRLVSEDIMDYISGYVLSGEAPSVTAEEGCNNIVMPDNFAKKVFKNTSYGSYTREESLEKLLDTFAAGATRLKKDKKAQADIRAIIENSSSNVNLSLIKTAKALISRLEAGLGWRIDAAKDIMNLDLIKQFKAKTEETWKVVQDFWTKFVDTIKQFNPKAYTIGEVTDLPAETVKAFIKATGFTCSTNYEYLFHTLSKLVHGGDESGYTGHISLTGEDPNSLKNVLYRFSESGYNDSTKFSHISRGNHDKARTLHGYAIDIERFFIPGHENEPVRDALGEALESAKSKLGETLKDYQKNAIWDAIKDYAEKRNGITQREVDHFRIRPYNYVIEDVVRRANRLIKEKNAGEQISEADAKRIIATIHNEMLKPALFKYRAMLGILVALQGNPTIYAGDPLGEIGFETPGNNVYLQNRNQLHRNWLQDADRPDIARFHDEVRNLFNLRNREYFSPLVNGDTIILDQFAGDKLGGVYRYNQNSDVIAIFNTNGFNNERKYTFYNAKTAEGSTGIPINAPFDIPTNAFGSEEFIRVDMNGKRVDDGYYKLEGNVLKRFVNGNPNPATIEFYEPATYFVRNINDAAEKIKQDVEESSRKAAQVLETVTKTAKQAEKRAENGVKVAERTVEKAKMSFRGKLALAGTAAAAGIALVTGAIMHHAKKNKQNNSKLDKVV